MQGAERPRAEGHLEGPYLVYGHYATNTRGPGHRGRAHPSAGHPRGRIKDPAGKGPVETSGLLEKAAEAESLQVLKYLRAKLKGRLPGAEHARVETCPAASAQLP